MQIWKYSLNEATEISQKRKGEIDLPRQISYGKDDAEGSEYESETG